MGILNAKTCKSQCEGQTYLEIVHVKNKYFLHVSNSKRFVSILFPKVCDVYTENVEMDKSPHIVLDTTMTPVISEIAKSFTSGKKKNV